MKGERNEWKNKEKTQEETSGITLVALVITIVLNCSCLAMEWMKKREEVEKNRNLMYDIIM